MVALLGGGEITGEVGLGLESTIGGGAVPCHLTTAYADAQLIAQAQAEEARVAAEWEASQTEKLAAMELAAKFAHEQYYGIGGEGYGTTPGGPDVVYFEDKYGSQVAEGVYQVLDPYYGEGGVFEPVTDWVRGEGKDNNLLLYAALGIGALALLKR